MVCLYCGSATRVANSRPQKRLHQTWRRRTCTKCGAIFTTNEAVDLSTSIVVRRPRGQLSPFSRDKLFISIYRAVGHRKQPTADAGALTATATAKLLHGAQTASVDPLDITKVTLQVLRRFDNAAAVQYAAYHKA